MSSDIRIGVMGLGKMGFIHCEQINSVQGLRLVAGSSRASNLINVAGTRFGIRTYNTHEQLLKDPEVDWVVISTTTDMHKEHALKALSHGKELIIEKPIALSFEDTKEIFTKAEEKKLRVTVHQNRRWDSDFKLVQKILHESLLGNVYRIESRFTDFNTAWGFWGANENNPWRFKKKHGGGILNDWGAHLFDQLLLLVDSKVKTMLGKTYSSTSGEVDDHFWAEILFKNKVSAFIEASHNHRLPASRWSLIGTEGTMQVEGGDPTKWNKALIRKNYGNFPESIEVDISQSELSIGFYEQFKDALINSGPLPVLPQEVLRTVQLVDAVRESDKSGTSVSVSI